MSNCLYVAWRAEDSAGGHWGPVGRLEYNGSRYRFVYTRGAQTLPGFYPFPGMDDLDTVYDSDELFPLFANRLLARSRPEYEAYLTWGGFDPSDHPDPIAILGVTEGRRATDSIEVFCCPQPDDEGCYISKFFLHGVRLAPPEALEWIANLQPGKSLDLVVDPSNQYDRHAVAVFASTGQECMRIGYVPRYLARDVGQLLTECSAPSLDLTVQRVNPGAPLQQRVLCRLSACWPLDFTPFAGEEFQPIVADVPSLNA